MQPEVAWQALTVWIQAILRADHLSEETRIGYSKRLALIAAAAKHKALQPVLTLHPQKVLKWIFRSYTELGTQRTMIVAILAAYKLLNFHVTKQASYAMYLGQYERLDAQLRDRAKDNVPTERQRAGFVSLCGAPKGQKEACLWKQREAAAVILWWMHFPSQKWSSCLCHTVAEVWWWWGCSTSVAAPGHTKWDTASTWQKFSRGFDPERVQDPR